MAARNFSRVQALNHSLKLIAGSFSVDATANSCTKLQGAGFTPVHLGEGEYAVDLDDRYPALLAGIATCKKSTAGDLITQMKSHNVSADVASSLEVQDLTYTAQEAGRDGDGISIEYVAADPAEGILNLTADITLTKAAVGSANNTRTFTLQVLAAAANPTDTVLVAFTGTAAAIVCTVTPNDGTNNAATPVALTTAELRELISTGAVVGKTITLTDASSLRALQTATGGGATALADGGEGDGVVATFADGTGIAAGAVVSVTSEAISVIIEDGVTPASAIKTAIEASEAASRLVSVAVSGTAADAQDAESETSLAGGANCGVVFRNLATATPTDADCEVHFQLFIRNTTAT
jgi:uncharacterized spore protein YtfJ